MYFPYFRGRQYELLALKELASDNLIGKSVTPVVEPVKLTSTFNSTFKTFNDKQMPIALILNPAVGDLVKNSNALEQLLEDLQIHNSSIIPSILINESTKHTFLLLSEKKLLTSDISVIIDNSNFLDIYKELFDGTVPKYTLYPDERQIRRTVSHNKVLFEDRFNKKERNADYPEDEFFSDDHLFFQAEGYIGFGDYSIIGKIYKESGFAPYAVAIHIVYFDSNNEDQLRIRHFVSDSNDDISDVAGKFHEAVSKLRDWFSLGQQWQITSALLSLVKYADSGYYPGLPTIKKLSIMHHLELMYKYLEGNLHK